MAAGAVLVEKRFPTPWIALHIHHVVITGHNLGAIACRSMGIRSCFASSASTACLRAGGLNPRQLSRIALAAAGSSNPESESTVAISTSGDGCSMQTTRHASQAARWTASLVEANKRVNALSAGYLQIPSVCHFQAMPQAFEESVRRA
jgi:hypothetical protein